MREAVILEAVRTPTGKRNGDLKDWRPDDLAGFVLQKLVERTGINSSEIDDVVMGCVTQIGEQGTNIARIACHIAGFPVSVPGTSVNRQCGSSQQASHFAAQAVMSGSQDLVIGAGIESMTRVAMLSDGGSFSEKLTRNYHLIPQGLSAELIAEKWGISRRGLDEFSLDSHQRAARAIQEGKFEKEIVPVPIPNGNGSNEGLMTQDQGVRFDTSLEKLTKLRPVFKKDGVITAGNSSQISDGASAILISSREKAEELGLKPRAVFRGMTVVGVDPTIMLTGPIPATVKVLSKTGLNLDDIGVFEVNEAFSSVPTAWMKELGVEHNKTNVNGGAIALGHPLGATGARLLTSILHEMERENHRYGLVTMCIGFGQGTATILELES